VDSRGFFSLQIGGSARYSTVIPDSSDDAPSSTDLPPNRAGRRFGLPATADSIAAASLMGCELRASFDTFRSNTLVLQGVKNLGQLDVGTIILYPAARVSGTLVSVTSLQAPKDARKALERANKALEKKNLEKAKKELRKAVEAYPKFAAAWFAMGQVHEQEPHFQDARAAYQTAIAADSNYLRPYVALARLAGIEQQWKEVAEITDHVVALNPLDFPEVYYLNSMAYYSLKRLDVAERSARKVLRLDPLHRIPAAYLILADILEQRQDFAGSIEQLRSYLRILPNAASADLVRARIKELEESLRKG
jgi:tetratricopeptide (TPR) repeat protein